MFTVYEFYQFIIQVFWNPCIHFRRFNVLYLYYKCWNQNYLYKLHIYIYKKQIKCSVFYLYTCTLCAYLSDLHFIIYTILQIICDAAATAPEKKQDCQSFSFFVLLADSEFLLQSLFSVSKFPCHVLLRRVV